MLQGLQVRKQTNLQGCLFLDMFLMYVITVINTSLLLPMCKKIICYIHGHVYPCQAVALTAQQQAISYQLPIKSQKKQNEKNKQKNNHSQRKPNSPLKQICLGVSHPCNLTCLYSGHFRW